MATDIRGETEPSIPDLMAGIAHDAQNLIAQQFTLLRRELHSELRRVIRALISLGVGAAVTVLGGILLLLMLVHLINALTSWPLWACYGLVGGLLAVTGALLLYFGSRTVSEVHLIAPPQTSEALKENLEWLKNPTTPNVT